VLRQLCKGKIHRATVTEANLNYVGSITIDELLMAAADIYPYERVQVVNVTNGARLETYAIPGAPGSGVICLNGAAARRVALGDIVIIIGYGLYNEHECLYAAPRIVFVDEANHVTRTEWADMAELLADFAESDAYQVEEEPVFSTVVEGGNGAFTNNRSPKAENGRSSPATASEAGF
jgi:aspartate 1-decarboxylase